MKRKLIISAAVLLAVIMSLSPYFSVVAQEEPFVGGKIAYSMGSDALTLNPYTYGSIYEAEIINHIYDGCVAYDVNNQPQPVLASSWTYNSTYEKYTFTIRENVYWHDGTPLTPEDVAFTWQMLQDNPLLPRADWLYDDIYSITVSGQDVIVEFTWGPKPADVLVTLGTENIVPKHIWQDIDDLFTYTNDNPIGCGPFKFAEWAHGQFFRLVRNENYYLGGPWIEELTIRIIRDDEAAYYALSVGEIELLDGPPPELEAVAKNDPNIAIAEYYADYIMYLSCNQRRWPNNITKFRQAVEYGINREEINEIVGQGRGQVCPASMSLPWGPWYNPDIHQYPYDPALANSTLDSIGITDTDSDGWREANGTEISFDLMVSAEYQDSVDTVRLIASYMADIGLEVNVKPVIWDVLWSTVGGPGGSYPGKYDYDWAFLGWVGFWSDFHPNWAAWMFNEDMWWGSDDVNIPGWSGYWRNLVTNLTTEILYETDEVIVKEKLDLVQEIVAEQLPYNPIRILGGVTLYRNDSYTGWVYGNTTGPDNWENWLSVHLIEPEEGAPGFTMMVAVVTLAFVVGLRYLKKRKN
ncbi:MAG: ABC transporter substrate-binding protein [Candidatus Heimdallarchaeaceae archaeon]